MPATEFDDHRGKEGCGGWWISLEEARTRSCNKSKWWEISEAVPGEQIQQECQEEEKKQEEQPDFLTNNGPEGKPVWLYSSGSMYVGQWKEQGTEEGYAVEHGYGVTYLLLNRMPRALVCFGKRKDGILNAMPGSKILT